GTSRPRSWCRAAQGRPRAPAAASGAMAGGRAPGRPGSRRRRTCRGPCTPRGDGRLRGGPPCPSSLAALLDERLHEVLGVGLQPLVDLVEDRVDVVVEGFLALRDVSLGGPPLLGGGLLTAFLRLLLLLGHDSTL